MIIRGNGADTVSRGLEQIRATNLPPDVYGSGELINSFEARLAADCGKEAAVFFPSGTMAQQIILRLWADKKGKRHVAYHPLCHLEIHEQDGLKEIHQMKVTLIGEKDRLFTLEDLKSIDFTEISAVLFELPQREIGGALPSWDELTEMTNYLRDQGVALHLDGARVLECLPYYGRSLKQVASLFDSLYLSFYKTLGGISGAMLIGSKDMMDRSKIWKRRYGGDLFHLYPYVLSAQTVYLAHKDDMQAYVEKAIEIGESLRKIPGFKVLPWPIQTNMFHLHMDYPKELLETALRTVEEQTGLRLISSLNPFEGHWKHEFVSAAATVKVPKKDIEEAVDLLKTLLK